MIQQWNHNGTVFTSASEGRQISVHRASSDSAPQVHFSLHAPDSEPVVVRLEMQSVKYLNAQGRSRSLAFRPGSPVVHDATVRVTDLLDSAEGVQVAGCYRLEPGGLDADFELTTLGPVEEMTLQVSCEAEGGIWRIEQSPDTAARQVLATVGSGGTAVALFVDLGDGGGVELAEPNRLQLNFFCQPLEKGVVLVARIGVRNVSELQGPLEDHFHEWQAQRAFL